MDPETRALVEGGISDRTVSPHSFIVLPLEDANPMIHDQMQCIRNLSAVLEEAGSSLHNVVKVGVFITDMQNFASMNKVYEAMFKDPKPVSLLDSVSQIGMIQLRLGAVPYLCCGQGIAYADGCGD